MLGTAQLGMDYGVANRTGRPDEATALAMVELYLSRGLTWFDTAQAYGASEAVLGRVFTALGAHDQVNVISKGNCDASTSNSLSAQVYASLMNLRLSRLSAWLLHDENNLSMWGPRQIAEAARLQRENRVGAFGVSVYHPESAIRAVDDYGFAFLQFPASPFDRRFLRNGLMQRLSLAGTLITVRSIYLQGLGIMTPELVPAGIPRGREAVLALSDFCAERGLERDHFCLGYVMQRTAAIGASLVVGMDNQQQLNRNLDLLNTPPVPPSYLDEWDAIWPEDIDELILPYHWKK